MSAGKIKVRLGPSGVHIFDRETGLNVLADEVKLPEASWATAPRQVSIALTNACDLACTYCYAPKFHASLAFEYLTNWLVELDNHGALGIGFGGGEPTLYPRFAELCRYAAQQTSMAVTFTTHSHHLSSPLLNELRGCVHFIRISMDGVGTTYEALRGRSFTRFETRVDDIREVAPFGLNFVVNAVTIGDLDAALNFAADKGAAEFLLLPEQPVGGHGGIDPTSAARLGDWVHGYAGPVRLAVTEHAAGGLPICDPHVEEKGLRAYAHIAANGALKRSSYDEQGVAIDARGVMFALNRLQNSNSNSL